MVDIKENFKKFKTICGFDNLKLNSIKFTLKKLSIKLNLKSKDYLLLSYHKIF